MDNQTKELSAKAIKKAIIKVKESYSPDKMIIQAVQALNETEQSINTEYERLREMYWRYHPEALEKVNSVEQLIKMIKRGVKRPKNSMGYDLSKEELTLMIDFAIVVEEHLKSLKVLESFIKEQIRKLLPETSKLINPILAAKLITLAGGLKSLVIMPSSTVQLLGAEKALFRHLRSGARPPKHGIILTHQQVQSAKNKGKAARQLANAITISLRKDYFGGKQ